MPDVQMQHHRQNPRLPSSYQARLNVPTLNIGVDVWVKDVSLSGLKLLGAPRLETGERVEVVVERLRLDATVRWWRDQKLGLVLDHQLTPEQIAIVRHMRVRENLRGKRHRMQFNELR